MKIKNFFVIAIFLSLIWHSFSFFLFKLAEPYSRTDEILKKIDVSLINLSKNIQHRTMSAKISELNKTHPLYSRFSLPNMHEGLPFEEISVGVDKKVLLDKEPDFQSRFVEHNPVLQKKNDLGVQLDYDVLPDAVKNINYSFQFKQQVDFETDSRLSEKSLQFSIHGTVANRQLLHKTLVSKQSKNDYIALSFSVDEYGRVKFVILEKYSGDPEWMARVMDNFKTWRFEAVRIIPQPHNRSNFEWGRIAFF